MKLNNVMGALRYKILSMQDMEVTRSKIKKLALLVLLLFIPFCFVQLLKICLKLPAQLESLDSYHLALLFKDAQNIPVDTQTIGSDDTTISIQINKQVINSHLQKMEYISEKWKFNDPVLKYFIPPMTLNDRVNQLVTLETFVRACEIANLTYFLWAGSLLGVYRHHGIIPWDDDVDIVMNASDWRNIRNVLSRVEGYGLFSPRDVQWKFYSKDLPSIQGKSFKWPFIDIFFFSEDSTHIWGLTKAIKTELIHRKEDIFPLQLRQYEYLSVAVPCKIEEIVFRQFGIKECQSLSCSHKNDNCYTVRKITCSQLYNIFPFVFRQKDTHSSNVVETLKQGNKIFNEISVSNVQCKPPK